MKDVYSDKKETIERDVNKRDKKDDKKSKPQAVKPKATWEYKVGEQLFGPYSTEEMLQWRDGVRISRNLLNHLMIRILFD